MNASEMVTHAEWLSEQYNEDGQYLHMTTSTGCSRSVQIESGFAFKAVHSAKYFAQNRSEWDFYHMTTDEIRAMLAKPLYISRNGRVIVMEALTPWYGHKLRFTMDYDEIRAKLHILTDSAYGFKIGDLHGGNWGVRKDGTVIALDYAAIQWQAQNWAYNQMPPEAKEATSYKEPDYTKDMLAEMLLGVSV